MRSKIFLLCALTVSVAALGSAEADLRKIWKDSARAASERDHLRRAQLLESQNYYHLALDDYLWAAIKNPTSMKALERAGELALILERGPELDRLVFLLKRRGLAVGRWPAALRAAASINEARAGNYGEAQSLLPSIGAMNSINDREARGLAFLHTASVHWNLGHAADADHILQAAIDQKSKVDPGIYRLQKARLYYEARKYQDAMVELSKLSRTSPSWYGGVLVGAWSAYILGDYNLTLGQVMTLQSPFLNRKFLPEVYILQAATLYQLCHYNSAKRSLQALKKNYGKFSAVLSRFERDFRSPQQKIAAVLGHVRGKSVELVGFDTITVDRLMDGIYQDDSLARLDRSLLQIAAESERFQKLFPDSSSPHLKILRRRYLSNLKTGRDWLYRLAARSISRRLGQMQKEVSESLENMLPIEVEINTQIRDRLAKSRIPVGVDVEFDAEIKKGFEFWPFEGEYWRDEVGSYAFATTGVCREKNL
jgi:hypothetical protein